MFFWVRDIYSGEEGHVEPTWDCCRFERQCEDY